ncbi:hypothetical protein ENHAE0001_0171 [Enhydrobacter aerosaccus SK60]|nr:hypothetical protein ENHAE0001_0171 [Enhydrobacter aerosaccus SK60]
MVKNLTAKKPQKAEQFPAQPCGLVCCQLKSQLTPSFI